MNFRRGLFRLWVILSVLWVAGVALVSGPDVYLDFQRAAAIQNAKARRAAAEAATVKRFAKYEATVDKDGLLEISIGGMRVQIEGKIFQLSPEQQQAIVDKIPSALPLPPGFKLDTIEASPEKLADKELPSVAADPWRSLLQTTAVALLPPLALLALGAALGWALSGFRRQA